MGKTYLRSYSRIHTVPPIFPTCKERSLLWQVLCTIWFVCEWVCTYVCLCVNVCICIILYCLLWDFYSHRWIHVSNTGLLSSYVGRFTDMSTNVRICTYTRMNLFTCLHACAYLFTIIPQARILGLDTKPQNSSCRWIVLGFFTWTQIRLAGDGVI